MERKDAIKKAMKDVGMTQEVLAEKMGYNGQTGISAAISRNISMDKFEEMMRILDFEIVIRRSRKGTATGEYKIGGDEQ